MESKTTVPVVDGCPAWTPAASGDRADAKEERRRRKRQEKLRRDSARAPDSWERFRILIEVVNQQRNVVEIADHKARYALIVLGVLNAIMFVLLGRGGVFRELPPFLQPWLVGLISVYAALTFAFVLHALDCLRPRELSGESSAHVHKAGIPGLLFWEGILQHDPAALRREWEEVRMSQLNMEAELISYRISHLIKAKYRALHRLYTGLVVLVSLCALLLIAYAIWGSVP
ncbi:MAG TPA: hypothetical protein VFZ26_11325 [Gemmatimonadales bacterium]